ncbi:MAG: HAD hydrolase-like protein [Rhodospirillales bacterium]|nr:HAD hydrolase-like protein [Rhodospirillales bacterium]
MRVYDFIAFDLDGVLIDSRPNMEAAWAAVRRKFRVDVPFADYFACIGLPFRDILIRLGVRDQQAAIEETFRAASIENFGAIRVFPGIQAALVRLAAHGLPLGIVTSKDAVRSKMAVDMIGVAFATVQAPRPGGETGTGDGPALKGKPAPDLLLTAARIAGVPPARSVYIGDMEVDCMTARNAGMDYIHVGWGYGPAPEGAVTVVDAEALCARLLGNDGPRR